MSDSSNFGLLGTLIERWRKPEIMMTGTFLEAADELEAALATLPQQEPAGLSELLELLWEMRRDREGSPNAFYAMADRAFKLADTVGALPPAPPQEQEPLSKLMKQIDQIVETYRDPAFIGSVSPDIGYLPLSKLAPIFKQLKWLAASPPAQEPEPDLSEVDCPHCNGIGKMIRAWAPAQEQEPAKG